MQTAARVSGATLGYIWNNLEGAQIGWELGDMAYTRYARKRRRNSYSAPPAKRQRILPPPRARNKESTTTTQYDTTTQYRYKRMPRRKKRIWKKFVKKVQAVEQKSLGTKTVLFNSQTEAAGLAGKQGYAAVFLYGRSGTKDPAGTQQDPYNGLNGLRDIQTIMNNDTDIMSPNTQGTRGAKFTFKSAVLDTTCTNIGNRSLEVDVYEVNVRTDDTKTATPFATIANAMNITDVIPNTNSNVQVDIANRGVTLFDLPSAISNDKWKIYKKRKYFVAAGSSFTFQFRDPSNYVINASENKITEGGNGSYAYRKMTRMFFFIVKNVSGYDGDECKLRIGNTRKYSYCVNELATNQDVYNPKQL